MLATLEPMQSLKELQEPEKLFVFSSGTYYPMPTDVNHESLREENRRDCYDDGYEDGQNNPFDHDKDRSCDEYSNSYYTVHDYATLVFNSNSLIYVMRIIDRYSEVAA